MPKRKKSSINKWVGMAKKAMKAKRKADVLRAAAKNLHRWRGYKSMKEVDARANLNLNLRPQGSRPYPYPVYRAHKLPKTWKPLNINSFFK